MKLLIVTQTVDRNHPILGFFHRWIGEFARHCAQVVVIGQSVEAYDLPQNVRVVSLGKERGRSKCAQVIRFWLLQWKLRKHYDAVFVHMTPIWVVLGAPVWMMLRKPVFLWYEARGSGLSLRLALCLVRRVFSASSSSASVRSAKNVVAGHGIDTAFFTPGREKRERGLLVTVGRMTRSKRLDLLIACLIALPEKWHLVVVGVPVLRADRALREELVHAARERGLADRVTLRTMTHGEIVSILQRAEMFLHTSETTLDKAVLEAMACGCLVISCSEAFGGVLPEACRARPDTMAEACRRLLLLPADRQEPLRRELREIVVRNHNLPQLIARLLREIGASVRL